MFDYFEFVRVVVVVFVVEFGDVLLMLMLKREICLFDGVGGCFWAFFSRASGVCVVCLLILSLVWCLMYIVLDMFLLDDLLFVVICVGEMYVFVARILGVAMVS